MHGGVSPGAPSGHAHACKHGRYGAEAIERRRELAQLVADMREIIDEVEDG
jgi:hypothetical protein